MNFKASTKLLSLLLLIFIVNLQVHAQESEQTQDVVYLNNGSIIKGQIQEIIPGRTIKIGTNGGSLFVYEMSEVKRNELGTNSSPSQDVVYLHNGSVIRGHLMEVIPKKKLKIQTSGGSLFVYELSEVKKIEMGTNTEQPQKTTSQNPRSSSTDNNKIVSSKSESQDAKSQNKETNNYRANYKDPGTAQLWGILVTGGGHLYAGETGTGLLLLGTGVAAPLVGYSLSSWDDLTPYYVGLGVTVASWIYSVVDSKNAARRTNRENGLVINQNVHLNPSYLTTKTNKSGYGVTFKLNF